MARVPNRHDALVALMINEAGIVWSSSRLRLRFIQVTGDDVPVNDFTKMCTRLVEQYRTESRNELKYINPEDAPSDANWGFVRVSRGNYVWKDMPNVMLGDISEGIPEVLLDFKDRRRRSAPPGKDRKRTACGRYVRKSDWLRITRAQKMICAGCGEQMLRHKQVQIDHIKPYADGGKTALGNLVALCWECNSYKGGRSFKELYQFNSDIGFMLDERAARRALSAAYALKSA